MAARRTGLLWISVLLLAGGCPEFPEYLLYADRGADGRRDGVRDVSLDRPADSARDRAGDRADAGLKPERPDLRLDAPTPDKSLPDKSPDKSLPVCWWDGAWGRRHKLTFDNGTQSENLVSFPVLVQLGPSAISYASLQASGQDLRFVDQDCTTVLAHEIESWSPGGTSSVWVRVPTIDAGSKTDHIWMYYSQPSAVDGQNPTQVWSAGYQGVFHLNGDLKDSTANANHGTNVGSTSTAGFIAGGRAFSFAGSQEVAIGGTNLPMGTSPRTICAWASPSALDTSVKHWFISYGKFVTYGGFFIGRVGQDLWCGGVGDDVIATNIYQLNTWGFHCCVVEPGNAVKLYANGKLVAGPQSHSSWNVQPGESLIGGHINPSQAEYWDGAVDEARIESQARSADWIRAQHLSMTGAFLTIGPVEQP